MAPADEPAAPISPASDPSDRTPSPTPALAPDATAATPTDPSSAPGLWGLALTALVALGCGLGGSYIYGRFLAQPGDPNAASVAGRAVITLPSGGAGADTKTGAETTDVRSPAPRETADRLDALSKQVDALRKQVDARSKAGPPPEVAALQVRIADLNDATNRLAPVPNKVELLDKRVIELSGSLTALRADVSSFQSRYGPTTRLASNSPNPREPRPDADPRPVVTSPTPIRDDRRPDTNKPAAALADPKALSKGAELFRRGRYKEAREVFNTLEVSQPDDARVWYYAALCLGFSTQDWTEGAVRLVEKGIAREEAGTPRSSVIDTEFRDLASSNGKDWLAAYRKRVETK